MRDVDNIASENPNVERCHAGVVVRSRSVEYVAYILSSAGAKFEAIFEEDAATEKESYSSVIGSWSM